MHVHHHRSTRRPSQRGLTLIEISLSLVLLVMGITAISRVTIGVTRASSVARERELALEGAKATLERIQSWAFAQAFRSFNQSGSDDPGLPGTAPGANFAIAGLRAAPDDADGMPGEVVLPINPADSRELLEESTLAALGMPRDLNGDGLVDGANHSTNYKLLPVLVRVRWQSADGTIGNVQLKTLLANY